MISKNKDFVNAFKTFNYAEGLVASKQTQKHESFFSKFMFALYSAYGDTKDVELPIFEEGITLY